MEGYKYLPNDKGIYLPRLTDDNLGLVQRCARMLLQEISRVRSETPLRKISINVSFMQLYNERIYDLLNGSMFRVGRKNYQANFGGPQGDPQGLKLKWNTYDVYTVENLFTYECTEYQQIMDLFHFGLKNKIIGTHKMNASSSRSHSIFTFTME
jgi:hypothetical protein